MSWYDDSYKCEYDLRGELEKAYTKIATLEAALKTSKKRFNALRQTSINDRLVSRIAAILREEKRIFLSHTSIRGFCEDCSYFINVSKATAHGDKLVMESTCFFPPTITVSECMKGEANANITAMLCDKHDHEFKCVGTHCDPLWVDCRHSEFDDIELDKDTLVSCEECEYVISFEPKEYGTFYRATVTKTHISCGDISIPLSSLKDLKVSVDVKRCETHSSPHKKR
jgi:hypothetical protein